MVRCPAVRVNSEKNAISVALVYVNYPLPLPGGVQHAEPRVHVERAGNRPCSVIWPGDGPILLRCSREPTDVGEQDRHRLLAAWPEGYGAALDLVDERRGQET